MKTHVEQSYACELILCIHPVIDFIHVLLNGQRVYVCTRHCDGKPLSRFHLGIDSDFRRTDSKCDSAIYTRAPAVLLCATVVARTGHKFHTLYNKTKIAYLRYLRYILIYCISCVFDNGICYLYTA